MRLDARMPNLVSELKSDNIRPFLGKKQLKTGKIGYFASFDFFLPKNGQMLSDFNSHSHTYLRQDPPL